MRIPFTRRLSHLQKTLLQLPSSIKRPSYPPSSDRSLILKTPDQQQRMREAGQWARELLDTIIECFVKPGKSTGEIDRKAHQWMISRGLYPSPLGYHGFPRSICTSINEEVCHGVPSERRILQPTDVLSIDVTVYWRGMHGDTCRTIVVNPQMKDKSTAVFLQSSQEALKRGIDVCGPDVSLMAIGNAIE